MYITYASKDGNVRGFLSTTNYNVELRERVIISDKRRIVAVRGDKRTLLGEYPNEIALKVFDMLKRAIEKGVQIWDMPKDDITLDELKAVWGDV